MMKIEKAHKILSNGLVNAPSEHEWCMAFEMSLDVMRKYQKIKQIYDSWNKVNDFSYNQAMRKIGEVLEDGNDKRM